MSASSISEASPERREVMSAMFASMVMQNANMALIFLGHAPNPQTGQTAVDLEHAQFFIEQLEMLAVKTKGNLDKNEESLLRQTLTNLRLAYVDAISKPGAEEAPPTDEQETPSAESPPEGETAGSAASIVTPADSTPSDMESKKKFTKKY